MDECTYCTTVTLVYSKGHNNQACAKVGGGYPIPSIACVHNEDVWVCSFGGIALKGVLMKCLSFAQCSINVSHHTLILLQALVGGAC